MSYVIPPVMIILQMCCIQVCILFNYFDSDNKDIPVSLFSMIENAVLHAMLFPLHVMNDTTKYVPWYSQSNPSLFQLHPMG